MTIQQELKKYKILVEIAKLYAGCFRACLDCPTADVFRQKDIHSQHHLVYGVVKILQSHNIKPKDAESVVREKIAGLAGEDGFCLGKNQFRPQCNGFGGCISIEQFVDAIEDLL